jgi:hypothetical protein
MGCRLKMSVDQGCLQGGVLSLLLCSLVMDGLLALLNVGGLHTQGYADDLALLINGEFQNTVSEFTQRALNIVQSRCRAKELFVIPDKMDVVLITKRTKVDEFIEPVL